MCFFSNVVSYILCQICPHPLSGSLRVNSEFNGCRTFSKQVETVPTKDSESSRTLKTTCLEQSTNKQGLW